MKEETNIVVEFVDATHTPRTLVINQFDEMRMDEKPTTQKTVEELLVPKAVETHLVPPRTKRPLDLWD